MANKKTIKFATKIFHDNKVYLKLSEVAKALNLLVKMVKPDASDTVYVDGIVVCEEEVYITNVDGQEVFGR